MGLFDFFKKKQPDVDTESFAYRILNMDKGSVFDYDLKSWVVLHVYEYQWQNGGGSVEYLVDCGTEQWFLCIDNDADLTISLTQRVKVRVIAPNLPDLIIANEQPPATIHFKDVEYLRDSESVGVFREENGEWADLISWDYSDAQGGKLLCVEQWGERDFDAACGIAVKDFQISNILPGSGK